MTEEQWLTCTDPRDMLHYCEQLLSARKKRLYLVACCRSVWQHIKNETCRQAVQVAERFADGLASADELNRAYEAARGVSDPAWQWFYRNPDHPQLESVRRAAWAAVAAANASSPVWAPAAGPNIAWALGSAESTASRDEIRRQAAILRCLLGDRDPLNPPLVIAAEWLTSDVLALAKGIYAERAFDRMPILADALQDAGCECADLLGHLRDPNATHVRGCWALDLVLGKE